MKEIISLGGGIQSSTLILMNLLGEIEPKAECAIFADTGWERELTYEYMAWLKVLCARNGFPIYRALGGYSDELRPLWQPNPFTARG